MTFVFRLLTSDFWIDLLISYSLLYFECAVTGTDGNCTCTDDTGRMVLALILKVLTALALMLIRVPHKIQSENFETGHLFSIAKLNFESICFLAFFDLRPFKLVHRHLKFLAFLHSENEVKICKIDKMAKNHFSRAEKGSQGV